MQIIIGERGDLKVITVDQVLEIKIDDQVKFRLKEQKGKLKIFAKEGTLKIEPIASNLILLEQKDDY